MSDIFQTRVLNYNLRSQTDFFRNTVNTTKFSLNSLRYFTALKYLKKIHNLEPRGYYYKFCQDCLHNVGYVNVVDN